MMVTTAYAPTADIVHRAKQLAGESGLYYVRRGHATLPRLSARYGADEWLIVGKDGIRYVRTGNAPVFFHPSTAYLRIQRLLKGESDPMLAASGAASGDQVLDCTAGLASDAIVFASRVGPEGGVTALESRLPIYLVVREGLSDYVSDLPELQAALPRIRMKHADHLDFLREQADDCFDIVYFDPMFRIPVHESKAIEPLRHVSDARPIRQEAVSEAVRVARKCVVLKEHRDSGEFARLGFEQVYPTSNKIAYGVIRCGGN
jgi:16S rRNA G966 N2-methylase RsmD